MRLVFVPLIWLMHRPVLIGREHMPSDGPCFVIANHSGMYDPLLLNYFITSRPFTGIMTDEYLRGKGILPYLFRKLGVVATRKFQPQTTPVRALMRLVQDNRIIVVMPEGESNWDGVTLPTVSSTGKLFRSMKVPVHAVIIHNSYLAYPRWAKWPRPVKVYVEFRPPLNFTSEMTDDEVALMVDTAIRWDPAIDRILYPWKRPWGFRPAAGITRLIFRCPTCGRFDRLREIRGRYLVCDQCGSRWRVGADSHLSDTRTNVCRSSTEIFRDIVKQPHHLLDFGPQGKGLILTPDIPVYEEVEYLCHELLGRFDCILRRESIDLLPENGGEPVTIPLSQIRSVSSEIKRKFQVRTVEKMYQLLFERGSMLQWQIYLKELLPHLDQPLVRPVNFAAYDPPSALEGLNQAKEA